MAMGFGWSIRRAKVKSSRTSNCSGDFTPISEGNSSRMYPGDCRPRSKQYFTACAVTGRPLGNLIPLRTLSTMVAPSRSMAHDSATAPSHCAGWERANPGLPAIGWTFQAMGVS